MKRILVPYDFSPVAEHALDFACQIASKLEGEIMLLNVIEHPTANSYEAIMGVKDDPMEQLYIKKMYEKVSEKLGEIVSNAAHSDDKISTKIQLGNAFNSIIDQITEEKVDLLIVGTEGAEGLNEFFVGSNAEKIVRHASCPVITIHEKAEIEPIEKIVFASGFMDLDEIFIEKVKELQRVLEAQLKIVKINTPASFTSTRHDQKQMDDFVARFGIENYTTAIYNCKNEEDGIMLYAEDVDADMIAIGTNQRKGIGHFFAGSIAEDIVNNAKIPVWTSYINS